MSLEIKKIFEIALPDGVYSVALLENEKEGAPHIICTKNLKKTVSWSIAMLLATEIFTVAGVGNGIVFLGKDLSEEKRIISIFKNDDNNPHSVRILFNDEINVNKSSQNGASLWTVTRIRKNKR
jgi:hypothetical protein